MPTVTIGTARGDRVTISVLGRMHAATDYWDGNWLLSPVEIHAGGFVGRLSAGLRADEIRQFRMDLERVYRSLHGSARLSSMEDWLDLTITVTGSGQFEVKGVARDQSGAGNELHFEIDDLDQSHAPTLIDELLALERLYPVLGHP
jgi:hypothetical protein